MKKLFIVLAMLIAMNANAQWVQMSNGMGNDTSVSCLTVSSNTIFAGTAPNGIYYSTNNGGNWTQSSINNKPVYTLATLGNNILAGTAQNGIYLSTNSGTSWSQVALNDKSAYCFAINGNTIFAGSDVSYGVYLSSNNGLNWSGTSLNNRRVYSLAASGSNIFAGTQYYGVYLSTNNGLTWIQTSLNDKIVTSLAILGNNIFAGTYDYTNPSGVYLSTNNGATWTQTALNDKNIHSLTINGNNIFAGTEYSGVYLSTNLGVSWLNKNQGFNSVPTVLGILVTNNFIFAGTWNSSVWRRSLSEIIGINNISTEIPSKFSLGQNYPNPFNPTTKIKFELPSLEGYGFSRGVGLVKLIVYDVMGREVQTLVNERLQPGTYEALFDGSMLNSGVYFYQMVSGDFKQTRKLILLK